MPLLPPILSNALNNLDTDSPKSTNEAVSKWSDAWWSYAGNMTYLNLASLQSSKASATQAFKAVLLPAFTPTNDPMNFLNQLGLAMTAAWGTLSSPASLTPPILSLSPAPAPFGPMAVGVVATGLAAPNKAIPRTILATLIDTWTRTIQAVGPSGPVGPIS